MSIFKCKMCGGDLDVREGSTVCECEYCGSIQTTPVLDSEKKTNLFNRANRLRMNSEFDKAAMIYASITAEFPHEAEAYWGLCLCKFGIEYVDDPLTGNKIPTCHRTLTTSILDDGDYSQAIQNADAIARPVYGSEAKRIDELQQDILQIVKSESPYDVFICYKETDEYGDRTEDSVLAYEIYESLTAKGLKVFFARVTLEDKLGQQYEPYIFAALQSARVMLVVGTSYENFDAVWVKNEWSRFLDMAKTDRSKKLIPCFKDIEIDELPRAFQRLQAQDLSKLGWLQDLTRGVMKICGKQSNKQDNNTVYDSGNGRELEDLDRAEVLLAEGLWEKADNYCDLALRHNRFDSRPYLLKLMAELHVRNKEELKRSCVIITENTYFKRAIQYAKPDERAELERIDHIVTENNKAECEDKVANLNTKLMMAGSLDDLSAVENEAYGMHEFPAVTGLLKKIKEEKEKYIRVSYGKAIDLMQKGRYPEASAVFAELGGYGESLGLKKKCDQEIRNREMYNEALSLQQIGDYASAAKTFQLLGNYRDSVKLAKKCAKASNAKSSPAQILAKSFHALFVGVLSLLIGLCSQNIVPAPKVDILMIVAVIGAIACPIFAWRKDRTRSTVRTFFKIVLCVTVLCVYAIFYKEWNGYVMALGLGAFIALDIVV